MATNQALQQVETWCCWAHRGFREERELLQGCLRNLLVVVISYLKRLNFITETTQYSGNSVFLYSIYMFKKRSIYSYPLTTIHLCIRHFSILADLLWLCCGELRPCSLGITWGCWCCASVCTFWNFPESRNECRLPHRCSRHKNRKPLPLRMPCESIKLLYDHKWRLTIVWDISQKVRSPRRTLFQVIF